MGKTVAEMDFLRLNIRQFDKAFLTVLVEMLKQCLKLKLHFVFFGNKCSTHSLRGKIFENAREILSRQNFFLQARKQCYKINSRDKILFKFQRP